MSDVVSLAVLNAKHEFPELLLQVFEGDDALDGGGCLGRVEEPLTHPRAGEVVGTEHTAPQLGV